MIVLKTADQKARLLRVLAPLGVLLPNGLGLNIDGTDMGRVAFVRCLPNGCVAEVVMDDALIKQLSTGKTAIFVVFKTPEEGIGIPVSLKGFADGFKQLPYGRSASSSCPQHRSAGQIARQVGQELAAWLCIRSPCPASGAGGRAARKGWQDWTGSRSARRPDMRAQ